MSGHVPGWLKDAAARVAAAEKLNVCSVELSGRILRVTIESPLGTTTLDDCVRFSQALSAELDYRDVLPSRYFLEVSSPGIERELLQPGDFVRSLGSLVRVSTAAGAFEGRLVCADDSGIAVEVAGRESCWLEHAQVKRARIRVTDAELFGGQKSRRQSRKRNDEQGHR